MAENKKSVLLYCDIIYTVEELDDVDAGLLFKHYLRYINDKNPEPPNKLIKIVFEPIKQNLKRDLRKWEAKSEKNKENANLRWNKNNANASERINDNANDAVKDTVIEIVKDKVIEKDTTNTHEVFAKRLLESDLEKESIDVSCREIVTDEILRQFNAHLLNDSKDHTHYSEYKKHLVRWIPKKPKQETKNGKSKEMQRVEKILKTNKELKDEIDREYGNE